MKVHIIGLPSSGKTTLAEDLSTRMGICHHDLDTVAFVDDRWTPRPAQERDALLAQILAEPRFVTEGGFLGWTVGLLAAADHIVWLDPPLRVLVWRHVRRHGLLHPAWLLARLRFQVLSYLRPRGSGPADDDPNQTRSGIEAELQPWADKVVRLRHRASSVELMNALPPVSREL
jgi:adenylate kinase family enzyme